MYAYVFDTYVQDQKHRTESARIETRLATLGIQGRSEKITILKNLQDSVRTLLKRGAETLIVVGNDQSVAKVLPLIVESDVALGIIPVGPDQRVAQALGMPVGAAACDIISRRIMRRIDLGMAGGAHFILGAELPLGCRVLCDKQYSVEAMDPEARMEIVNVGSSTTRSRPDDGRLELVVGGGSGGWFGRGASGTSVFPISTAKIERRAGDHRLVLDGQLNVNPPVTISVLKKSLHVIVGPDRKFE